VSITKSLIQRRQLLLAAMGSTCALTCQKLLAVSGPEASSASSSPTHAAVAAQRASASAVMAAGNRCPHLLSPLRIRDKVLKNRIMHTVSPPYFMQGPENYPTELFRSHYSNIAKNAAIITLSTMYGTSSQRGNEKASFDNDNAFNHYSDRSWDDTSRVFNYLNEMIDDLHYQGTLVHLSGSGGMSGTTSSTTTSSSGGQGGGQGGPGGGGGGQGGPGGSGGGAMPGGGDDEMAEGGGGMPSGGGQGGPGGGGGGPMGAKSDEETLKDAKDLEARGADVYLLRSSKVETVKKLRDATNLILMARYTGPGGINGQEGREEDHNSNQPTAKELEEAVEDVRKFEGVADIIWIRIDEHPNAWTQDKGRPKSLAYAEAIKKAGIKIITCPSAGFHDPVENDRFIASGRTDMVGMTTPFFADPELVRKLKEGRADDILPCLGCANCHGISMNHAPWYSTCTVNPTWGLPPYQLKSITKPAISKKVAVIGGGPAGMKAALVAAERGHKVTIYEKDAALGGLLKISDNVQCRWNFKDLKEYYIHQVKKAGITIKLNTAATPAIIKAAKYDTVMVATGSDVAPSEVKADGVKVFSILDSYNKKNELGKNVVVLGAGKHAIEAAVCMLKDGHKVTLLASGRQLVEPENSGPHNMRNQESVYQNNPNFIYALKAKVKEISGGKVTYTNSKGVEKSAQADSIVVWSGVKPRMDEAEKFFGSADEVLLLGDCTGQNGSLQKAFRSAFFVASQV
jgi:2,4-dienoyl-CoA reductase-like NADH-dependent reductase (Old Yellow Enzyme family)/thioredoxin reductase